MAILIDVNIFNKARGLLLFVFMFAGLSAFAQTNVVIAAKITNAVPLATNSAAFQTNQALILQQIIPKIRADCIQSRRSICGKILEVVPNGLVVDSGYTNLLRSPINRSWLVPGTVSASRATGLIEGKEPGAVCVGLVFLTDLPKVRKGGIKPKVYDYVILQGFPMGDYTYTSMTNVQRTIRKFSGVLEKAIEAKLQAGRTNSIPANVK